MIDRNEWAAMFGIPGDIEPLSDEMKKKYQMTDEEAEIVALGAAIIGQIQPADGD